jgi:hypothetical protein
VPMVAASAMAAILLNDEIMLLFSLLLM